MQTVVTTEWVAEHLNDEDIVVAHLAWVHQDSAAAYADYLAGHVPGAIFIDVDGDLSEIGDARRGRHPLPTPEKLVERLARKGIGQGKRVIATERESFKVAARLWWLLRWIGVDDVAVLDGGLAKWQDEGRPVETTETTRAVVKPYAIHSRPGLMLSARDVEYRLQRGEVLLDARAVERFRGEVEALDKRAGHIVGARSIALGTLITGSPAHMKSPEELRAQLMAQGITPDQPVTAYCGSGVTACQLLLALDQAGYYKIQLYSGSWSEWIELHPTAGRILT